MRDDIFLSEDNLLSKDLTDGEIVILLALNGIIVGNLKENYINYSTLCSAVFDRKVKESERKSIKNSFCKLVQKNIITIIKELDKNTFICNVENVFVNVQQENNDSEFYVHITKSELQKIMNISENVDNYKLLRVFLCYINSLHKGNLVFENYRNKIGFMPQEYICNISQVHIKSLYKYDKILETNQLIYIVRHKIRMVENQEVNYYIKGATNTYSRYQDKELCEEYASIYKSNCYTTKSLTMKKFKMVNSQKYKYFLKGREYTLLELYEILEYASIHNYEVESGINKGELIDTTIISEAIEDEIILGTENIQYQNHFILDYQGNYEMNSSYFNNYEKKTGNPSNESMLINNNLYDSNIKNHNYKLNSNYIDDHDDYFDFECFFD